MVERGKKWMSFLTLGHMRCMCEYWCVRVSSVARSLNADLHCKVRCVAAVSRSLGRAVLFATKLLRLKEKLLKHYWLLCSLLTTILSLCWWCCLATEPLSKWEFKTLLGPRLWLTGKHFCGMYFLPLCWNHTAYIKYWIWQNPSCRVLVVLFYIWFHMTAIKRIFRRHVYNVYRVYRVEQGSFHGE